MDDSLIAIDLAYNELVTAVLTDGDIVLHLAEGGIVVVSEESGGVVAPAEGDNSGISHEDNTAIVLVDGGKKVSTESNLFVVLAGTNVFVIIPADNTPLFWPGDDCIAIVLVKKGAGVTAAKSDSGKFRGGRPYHYLVQEQPQYTDKKKSYCCLRGEQPDYCCPAE